MITVRAHNMASLFKDMFPENGSCWCCFAFHNDLILIWIVLMMLLWPLANTLLFLTGEFKDEDWDRFVLLLDGRLHVCNAPVCDARFDPPGSACVLLKLQNGADWRGDRLSEEGPCRHLLLLFLPFEISPDETSEEDLPLLPPVSLNHWISGLPYLISFLASRAVDVELIKPFPVLSGWWPSLRTSSRTRWTLRRRWRTSAARPVYPPSTTRGSCPPEYPSCLSRHSHNAACAADTAS